MADTNSDTSLANNNIDGGIMVAMPPPSKTADNGNCNNGRSIKSNNRRASSPVLPTAITCTIQLNDVLSGRGGRINSHLGNVHFRELVDR